jgi:hypothetical protein
LQPPPGVTRLGLLLLLAGCTTANAQRAFDSRLAQLATTPLEAEVLHARLKALPGAQLERTGDELSIQSNGRRLAKLTLQHAAEGTVTVSCQDEGLPGFCEYRVWPLLYPDTYAEARREAELARDGQQALDKQAEADAEVSAAADLEQQERDFRPYWGPLLGAAAELGLTPGGLIAGAWARAGVRRFHTSLLSSGCAVQLGAMDMPGVGAIFDAAVPLRVALDWFPDTRFDPKRGPLPVAELYPFVSPSLLYRPGLGFGGGVRAGVGGQIIVTDRAGRWPLFTEVSYEQLYLPGRTLAGVRFSIGLGL